MCSQLCSFLFSHFGISSTGLRDLLISRLVSTIAFVCLIVAYGHAETSYLWIPYPWTRLVTPPLLVLFAFFFVVIGLATRGYSADHPCVTMDEPNRHLTLRGNARAKVVPRGHLTPLDKG